MYLDDVSIGGALENIFHDLNVIKDAQILGLTLNNEKSEIICKDVATRGNILCSFPGAEITPPREGYFVGLPFGGCSLYRCLIEGEDQGSALDGHTFQAHVSPRLPHSTSALFRHSEAAVPTADCTLFPVE